ncbi:MAG: response regulator [Puniceicoccaceae bacterium]|nr:MAG: response regulator [Puniceicoccaceae bacterium]
MITSQTLESFGYRVRVAADGAEGLALFASHREEIKAVVVDLMMPVMDGRATIKALRRIQPGLKIIAVSGLKSEASLEDAEEPGATLFLPKPFTAETLLEALHEVLHPEEEEEAGD